MTSIFSYMGNVTPYVVEQNVSISCALPGSWPPNWLREAEDAEPTVAVGLLELLESRVLGRETTLRRDVDEEEVPRPDDRRGSMARRAAC